MAEVIYPTKNLIPSYYDCLSAVAAEKIYIETIKPYPLEQVSKFQGGLIEKNGPVYYAVEDNKVIGWCDIFPKDNPRQSHRGGLGMGLLEAYRGKGLGSQLLEATLSKAEEFGLEKVELTVYTENKRAIELYKKFGFIEEGLIKSFRKIDGKTFDALMMAKFL